MRKTGFVCLVTGILLAGGRATAEEKVDLAVVHRIRAEAFEKSKVMDHLFYLTDVHGPRLTNSPGYRRAAEWVERRLREYGLVNVKQESMGSFGRGWSCTHFEAHMLEPQYSPLIGFPLAWTEGTNGPVAGEPVLAPLLTPADFEKWKGKLRGKIVLIENPRALEPVAQPLSRRYAEADLSDLWKAPEPGPPRRPSPSPAPGPPRSPEEVRQFRAKLAEFLRQEGARVSVGAGFRGDGGTVFAAAAGSRETKEPLAIASIAITPEHYNRIARLLEKKVPVKLEVEVATQVHEDSLESWNVTGEIPGVQKKEELVMLGGHLDSWHGGTGATDNAAGVAVAIEAARILKALGRSLDRTIRLGFWTAEEQGLLGSRAYVKEHFGDPETMQLKPAHSKLSAYFNYDNGGGKIRGIYLQGNDMVRPIFQAWLAPFHDTGATTVTIRNTSGTDHLAFDAVGLPAFQFVQDPLEYYTRTHHSNMDVYDRIVPADLMQASAVMASFVYHTAVREEMLPRKPLPPPRKGREGRGSNPPSGP